MNYQSGQHYALEDRFERLLLDLQSLTGEGYQLGAPPNPLPSSGGYFLCINPIVIASGGSVTGQTINVVVAGTVTATVTTNATVYNIMPSATVATSGHYIVVQPNPDGTYTAVTQGC